jgi:hypothetical protein
VALEPRQAQYDWSVWGKVCDKKQAKFFMVSNGDRCNEILVHLRTRLLSVSQEQGSRVWGSCGPDAQVVDEGAVTEGACRAPTVHQCMKCITELRREQTGENDQ